MFVDLLLSKHYNYGFLLVLGVAFDARKLHTVALRRQCVVGLKQSCSDVKARLCGVKMVMVQPWMEVKMGTPYGQSTP